MINKYNDFRQESIMDLIEESVIYFSSNFSDALRHIDSDISRDLLDIETKDIKPNISFVDMDEDGLINFINSNSLKKSVSDEELNILSDVDLNYSERSELAREILQDVSKDVIKTGRFVNRVLGEKYSDSDIEIFVNSLKARAGKKSFEIVSGEEISKWYNNELYKKGEGTLNKSCMRYNSRDDFEIYDANPEVCRMLILIEDGKLIGRAILWTITKCDDRSYEGRIFMDRQYTVEDSDILRFRNYAIDNNWLYKSNIKIMENNSVINLNIAVDIKRHEYIRYPYLDTLNIFDYENYVLSNSNYHVDVNSSIVLDDTDGGYSGGVWSEYTQEYIDRDDAVYSDELYTFLDRNYSEFVNDEWYPTNGNYIERDCISGEWLMLDELIYSDAYGDWIKLDNSVSVPQDIDSYGKFGYFDFYDMDDSDIEEIDQETLWYKILQNIYEDWQEAQYILKEDILKNFEDKMILREFKIDLYESKNGVYLTNIDAMILGLGTSGEPIFDDHFNYNNRLESAGILEEIIDRSIAIRMELENTEPDSDISKEIEKRVDDIESGKYVST